MTELFHYLQASRMGAEAVLALMDATPDTPPCVISLDGNVAVRVPLMQCVQRVSTIVKYFTEESWCRHVAG